MTTSIDQLFTKQQRIHFDSCCQYFELALSYFGYNVQAQCCIDDKKKVVLYAVNVFYQGQQRQVFTALTLDEFYKKMELVYQLYMYAKDHQTNLDEALDYYLDEYQQFIAVQGEIDDLLNWQDFIDEELGKTNSYSYDMVLSSENRTLH
ncbi:hypothetical protein [Cysteiniphilum halobium]|uniref:hypothetical protein n=1 Tax=Cysteiniphilum halobium TaxID=2219059 RepID=UPI000E652150|nr:hypothetical protein [Cysteiniphilum halobium]